MKKLTKYDITHIIRRYEPKTMKEFADFGLRIRYVGEGCSREVWQIIGYGLVVKIPKDGPSAKRHAEQEHKAWLRIKRSKKKYKALRPYLPNIYCCTKNGIILMEKYRQCYETTTTHNIVGALVKDLFPTDDGDIYSENMGKDKKGRLVILDFGCFFPW
jgi:hypothetical protein